MKRNEKRFKNFLNYDFYEISESKKPIKKNNDIKVMVTVLPPTWAASYVRVTTPNVVLEQQAF